MQLTDVVTSLDSYRARKRERTEAISTGSLSLDLALGGGWRKGRIVELSGDYSTYKTSLARHTVAQAQKRGLVLWIDGGGDFNPTACAVAGCKLDDLAVARPDSALDVLSIVKDTAAFMDLIVVDNAPGLAIDSGASWSQEFGWVKAELSTTTVLFTSSIAVTNPFIEEARNWATQRVRLYPEPGKGRVSAVISKNAFAPPPTFDVKMQFDREACLDHVWELVQLAVAVGVIRKRGSWLFLAEDNSVLGHGVNGAITEAGARGLFGKITDQVRAACS